MRDLRRHDLEFVPARSREAKRHVARTRAVRALLRIDDLAAEQGDTVTQHVVLGRRVAPHKLLAKAT